MKKQRKQGKLTRWISGGGLLFLISSSVICVGFSAWTIGQPIGSFALLNVTADDDVIDGDIFQNIAVTSFTLSLDGIVSDETIFDSGKIDVNFSIDNVLCFDGGFVNSNNVLTFETRLGCTNNLDFLSTCTSTEISVANSTVEKISGTGSEIKNRFSVPINGETTKTETVLSYLFSGDLRKYGSSPIQLNFEVSAIK